jgi:cytochrome d ubiquinol oxidase subunit I
MDNLFAARSQMALSLGFHIIFSCIAMVMPFCMSISHLLWLRTGNPIYKAVTKAWSKGVAIFFATGAVSGTVLSFELGLLWPAFMQHAGPIIGMPFSLEGTAFFMEAIALGFYLYGWNRLNPWFHWFTGLAVGACGVISGILVISANSWMNCPAGFDFINKTYTHIDPLKAMFNKAWFSQSLHMTIAAFAATGFAVAGIHAWMILRRKNIEFHLVAFRIAAFFAAIASVLQPISGDLSARFVAKNQPAKLAAMEAHFKTEKSCALIIGGIPDVSRQEVDYAIRVPGMLSFMVNGNSNIPVKGMDQIPPEDRPPIAVTHYAFQVMVGLGMAMMGISLLYFFTVVRKRKLFAKRWFLWLFAAATPVGFIAVEAGWTVTEVGRQPWIVQGIMRTADAVTPMPGVPYSLGLFAMIYVSLSFAVIFLLIRHIRMLPVTIDNCIRPKIS